MSSAGEQRFSSNTGFIFAAMGSAVGFGNIWRFPYLVGENGGGAFVLLYLLFVFAIALPALIATIHVGRKGRASPIKCFKLIAERGGFSRHWVVVGWLLVISAYLLLSFFSVVASWTLEYIAIGVAGDLNNLSPAAAGVMFDDLRADPWRMALWHGLFMGTTLVVVSRGIRRGIERAVRLLMPLLFVLVLFLAVFALVTGEAVQAIRFLFTPDFSNISGETVLLAMGQALVTLSVGGAGMVAYGAYMSEDASIPRSAMVVALADTAVALCAGLMIFPIVFAFGLEAAEGPGLIFVTLPVALSTIDYGGYIAVLFFVLLLVAALTSAFSMSEPVVAWLTEHKGMRRSWASLLVGLAGWFIGLAAVLSFNIWDDIRPLALFASLAELNIFLGLQHVVANLAMPLGAFLVAVFVGWKLNAGTSELFDRGHAEWQLTAWRLIIRVIVPLSLAGIVISNL